MVEFEKESLKPDFWVNSQHVQKVNQRISFLKDEIGEYEKVASSVEDLQTLFELAIAENAASIEPEIESGLKEVSAQLEKIGLRLMLNGEFDKNNAILSIHPGAGGVDAPRLGGYANADVFAVVRPAQLHIGNS